MTGPNSRHAREAAEAVLERLTERPKVAIVLGSGLGDFADTLTAPVRIPYDDIPHYPQPTVPGHVGELVLGRVGNLPVLTARGRFHYYEGHGLDTITLPIRLFSLLGAETVIITNAAGCVNTGWSEGDLMLITGHLDSTYLRSAGDRQPVMDEGMYRPEPLNLARGAARETGIELREGIYAWALGPSYETPAEIRHIRRLGGDAVGMSTLPEIEAAAELGLQVIGISCLTNYAAGIRDVPLNHAEVLATSQRVQAAFGRLVTAILGKLAP